VRRFLSLLLLGTAGCPNAIIEVPTVEGADDQVATCKVAKDPLNPLIVEWPGTNKVELDAATKSGIVLVSYKGCTLKVLPKCSIDGGYNFTPVTPARDTLKMSTVSDLYAKLPLGAASLKAELALGTTLELDYIAVGQRLASSAPKERVTGDCSLATHYIDRITVGAYHLDALASGELSGGVEVPGAGVGAGRKEANRRLRGSGELTVCEGQAPNTESEAQASKCYAILQIGLSPIEEALLQPGAAPRPTEPGPEPKPEPKPVPQPTSPLPLPDKPPKSQPRGNGDMDADGLNDRIDACADVPEDVDGYRDDDGCPDPDNDLDGVADIDDRCPNTMGTEAKGGCP
jgi:hypothetical protein